MKKILVLHGNRQTGELLQGRIAKLQKAVNKDNLKFVAPDAPFLFADGDEDMEESCHNNDSTSSSEWQRTWWHRNGNNYNGLEESLAKIQQLWDDDAEDGNFVGILGFSQGSRLAHLISLLHTVTNGIAFRGLQSVVHVSGYHSPIPPELLSYANECHLEEYRDKIIKENVRISIPSLHVMGEKDQLIPLQSSEELLAFYSNPSIHLHPGGHHVPVKARDIEQYLAFWRKLPMVDDESVENNTQQLSPDEEHAQAQIDEVCALSQIFPSEFTLLSETSFLDPDNADSEDYSAECRNYTYPIKYTILLQPEDEMQQELWPPKDIALHVSCPIHYPDCSPIISLQHEMNYLEFSINQTNLLMQTLKMAMKDEEGIPCVMSLVYAARDFFADGGLAKATVSPPPEEGEDVPVEDSVQDPSDSTSSLLPSSDARIKECRQQGWLIACKMLDEYNRSKSNNTGGKGGSWKTFTIGLVGKPSAGKSTFFNAATAFARQRNGMPTTRNKTDDDKVLGGATMAPHPFTTIDANIGYCYVPVFGSCPEDEQEGLEFLNNKGISIGSSHGRVNGKRLLPVVLKDVAGLVPGAYEGRGKGNKFLDDLTDADVLIHVVDASGKADAEGNQVCESINNPINDLEWIRNEIVAWVRARILSNDVNSEFTTNRLFFSLFIRCTAM